MLVVKAPGAWRYERPTIFLAGSIEMGAAEDWQSRVVEGLADRPGLILNPRRDDWDSTWPQRIDFAPFREQVEWELVAIDLAHRVLVYFDPATKSPVTMLELGILTKTPTRVVVCCPDGFWRKGNVDIICNRYDVPQVDSLDALVAEARRW